MRELLPALHAPTINPLTESGWYAVEADLNEAVVREIIPSLKEAGAEGIIEISLNKVVAEYDLSPLNTVGDKMGTIKWRKKKMSNHKRRKRRRADRHKKK